MTAKFYWNINNKLSVKIPKAYTFIFIPKALYVANIRFLCLLKLRILRNPYIILLHILK